MEAVIIALIVFGVVIVVLEPYFTGKKLPDKFITKKEQHRRELQSRLEVVNANIRDLELEYQTGMVSGDDYRVMSDDYKQRLEKVQIELLRTGGTAAAAADIDQLIEEDIVKRRVRVSDNGKSAAVSACPSCGENNAAGANFCSSCGHKLL